MKSNKFNYTNALSKIQAESKTGQDSSKRVNSSLACSMEDAQHFLKLLSVSATKNIFCFRSIDPKKKEIPCNYTGTLEQNYSDLEQKNILKRVGIFVVINEGGHKDANIVRVRAVFCDWDDLKTAVKLCEIACQFLEPHIIVESSPGKRHAYWLVDDLTVEKFRIWQEHLIEIFESDKSIKNESRVMRVPGFFHTKNEPFMTRIIKESSRGAYNEIDLITAFGNPEKKQVGIIGSANPANPANPANLSGNDDILTKRVVCLLQSAVPGERHNARLKAGRLAGGFVASGLLNESEIINQLMSESDYIADNGHTDKSEIKTILDSIEIGKKEPIFDNFLSGNHLNPRQFKVDSQSDNGKPQQNILPDLLRAPLTVAEPFPVEALGEVLSAAALALNRSIKAPLALCCQSVLASATLAVQPHFDVELPWGDKKPLSLLFLSVADSGERKSALDDVVLTAAKVQEKKDMQSFYDEMEAYEHELSRWKTDMDAVKKMASKSKGQALKDNSAEVEDLYEQKPVQPINPLRFVSDPTIEGLFKLMASGQPNIGLFSDEGGLLIGGHAMNADNALKTLARWCKLWDGAPFDRVRAGDGSSVLYGRRFCMHQMAQSEVMGKLLNDRMANSQGFLARCLVIWPETTIGSRTITEFTSPKDLKEVKRLFEVLKVLTEASPRIGGSEQELDPLGLPLDKDAIEMAVQAHNCFEDLMKEGNDLAELTDRTSKALENACRIAGVLAVIENGMSTRSISSKHFGQGLTLIQWYLKESLRIGKNGIVTQAVLDAEELSKWLKDTKTKVFRTAKVFGFGPNQLRNRKRLMGAIKELVNHGYLVENENGTVVEGVKARSSWRVKHYVV